MAGPSLPDVAVPYPELLAVYQERVAALTHECLTLRAAVAHLQRTAPPPVLAPVPDAVAEPAGG